MVWLKYYFSIIIQHFVAAKVLQILADMKYQWVNQHELYSSDYFKANHLFDITLVLIASTMSTTKTTTTNTATTTTNTASTSSKSLIAIVPFI